MDEEELYRIYEAHRKTGGSHEDALRAVQMAQAAPPEDPTKAAAQRRLSGRGGSAAGDFARMAVQGATFGFGDELAGLLHGMPGTKGYERARDASRERIGDLRTLAPGASALSEIAGGVAIPMLGAAKTVAKGGGVGRAVVTGAKLGGLQGAVTGFGESEGGIEDRLPGAAGGAVRGAAIGAAVAPLPALAGLAGTKGAGRFAGHRASGRGERVLAELRSTAGIPEDFAQAVERSQKNLDEIGDLYYKPIEQAYPTVDDPDVIAALSRPELEDVVGAVSDEPFTWLSQGPKGRLAPGRHPSVTEIRDVRRILRQEIDAVRPTSVARATRLEKALEKLNDAFRKAVPETVEADKLYHAEMAVREATEEGRGLFSRTAGDVELAMKEAEKRGGPAAVRGMRVGMLHDIVSKLGQRDERAVALLRRFMDQGTETTRLVRTLFPKTDAGERGFRAFQEAVNREKSAEQVARLLPQLGKVAAAGAGVGAAYQILK